MSELSARTSDPERVRGGRVVCGFLVVLTALVLAGCEGSTPSGGELSTSPSPTTTTTSATTTTSSPAPVTTTSTTTTTPPPAVAPQPQPQPQPEPKPQPKPQPAPEPQPAPAYYKNCAEARAAGAAPLHAGEPGYRSALDRDGDGVACE
ncbi:MULTISPECIES: excalibur calcium-binding domain-containing protein [Actinosynnema]|uniref:excalibur calcium-binding domain-containing protein n=1 Tax=Actinosynnema TaxID=40566 RepID=UPI0020A43C54|nr:excalibur calcium-binding domain-containing protein [Actinosynnema pretiosum]MCP2096917.1 Excalibur calcium-binding domain-containing protein [Actinosynnema pretiosum]